MNKTFLKKCSKNLLVATFGALINPKLCFWSAKILADCWRFPFQLPTALHSKKGGRGKREGGEEERKVQIRFSPSPPPFLHFFERAAVREEESPCNANFSAFPSGLEEKENLPESLRPSPLHPRLE